MQMLMQVDPFFFIYIFGKQNYSANVLQIYYHVYKYIPSDIYVHHREHMSRTFELENLPSTSLKF